MAARAVSLAPDPWPLLFNSSLGTSFRLLQNRNLPRMIELVLRHAVQHVREIVALARHAVAKARVGQSRNGFNQRPMSARHLGHRFAPGRWRGIRDGRKILSALRLAFLSAQPDEGRSVPRRDV